jgi:hypothetical protein
MNTNADLRLHEWIAVGRRSGKIRDLWTVVLAYCLDEREALPWIAGIISGQITEPDALVFMERAFEVFHNEGVRGE